MKLRFALCLVAALAACSDKNGKEVPQPTVENRSVVVFPAGSPQLAAIVSVPIEPRTETVLRFNGRLVWNEDRTVRVFAPFAGRVTAIAVRPGDRIAEGQSLATLSAPELGLAQAEARKAEQDFVLAQKNLARVEELQAAGVAPAKELLAAQADVARAGSERSRAMAKLKLYGKADAVDQALELRSPIAGVVVERNLNPGQELRPDNQGDKALFVISDPSQLWFFLDVAEKDVGSIKPGIEVKISTTSLGDDRATGRISHVADLVDPQARTVKVRGVVAKADARLKAEMYMVAELRVPSPVGYLVPTRAVYLRGEQTYVFIDQGGGRFARHAILPGPVLNGHQVVLGGIAASDKVVVEGNLLLERLLAAKD
ncbi:MAG TPA: efflux RND transporter periplasmic adaptor subunit [Burkholderiales bacterium]